ncbi:ribbon-helix-helix protein, CopG family [Streptomyces sp. NPDC058620]|uniref:ribbon-helix-helix domain-containing protein n=1 Tax=Streptomyces sp. NPDC058620 TaxID=3346560 RepID=UPI003649F6EF
MELKRTTVYADAADLAIIKEAAGREGISEAEIIREAIHLAALSKRTWRAPLALPVFRSEDPETAERAEVALGQIWDRKAKAYEESKRRPRP